MTQRVGAVAAIAAIATFGALAAAGCTDLPDIPEGVCGNRVLDPGEDCDGASAFDGATCGAVAAGSAGDNACHYTCDLTACPAGWGCGIDRRCRAPGGLFEPVAEATFPVLDFAAGDVDGDGLNDLIGNTATTIAVLYGTDTGELPTGVDVSTRTPTGPITFASFDAGGTLDAVVPVDAGLFTLLGQADRSLLPFAYAPFEIPQGGTLKAISVEAEADADAELAIIGGARLQLFDDDTTAVDLPLDRASPPVRHRAEQIPGRIPVARLGASVIDGVPDNEQDPTTEFALSFSDDNRVFVYTTVDTSPETPGGVAFPAPEVVFLNAADVAGTCVGPDCIDSVQLGVDFGDVDGDGDLDLLISGRKDGAGGGTRQVTLVALNDGSAVGGFFPDAAEVDTLIPTLGDGPIGDQLWPIEVADLGGDSRADYVFPSFIAITAEGSDGSHIQPVAIALGGAWTEALAIDVNADGRPDVVTSVEGDDGIDVYINTGALLFNQFRVDTADPVAGIRGGDFDGDLVGDLALIEKPAGEDADRVSVVFGAAFGAPSQPVSMGSFDRITVLESTFLFLGFEALDLISDLVVISDSVDDQGTPSRAAALLQGSSARRMLSPFTLQTGPDAEADRPVAAVVGQFSRPSDGTPDIMAVGQYSIPQPTGQDELRSRLYKIPGKNGDGNLDTAGQQVLELPPYEEFDASCAAIVAGDIDPGGADGIDEVVAIDGLDRCFGGSFSPSSRLIIGRVGDGIGSELIQLGTEYSNVRSVRLADLDGDGDNDLVALFVGAFRDRLQDGIKPAVVVFWNDAGAFADDSGQPREVTIVPADANQLFHDFDLVIADNTGLPQLAVLTTTLVGSSGDGVSDATALAALDPTDKRHFGPWRQVADGSDGRMAVADLNGDGLEDLAIMTGLSVIVWLQVEAPPRGGGLVGIDQLAAPEVQ
jgi:hypothetical protein